MITHIDGATGDVTENPEVIFSALGQERLACPSSAVGKDWESVYTPPRIPTNPVIIGEIEGRNGHAGSENGWQSTNWLAERLAVISGSPIMIRSAGDSRAE